MLKATVTGRIWSTKKLGDVPTGSILEVQVVATGSVAAAWFPGKAPPIDALIIGSIDESSEKK
jgi:ethanolamine utilization protein EutN